MIDFIIGVSVALCIGLFLYFQLKKIDRDLNKIRNDKKN